MSQKFRPEWEKEYFWVKPVEEDVFKAKCTVCNKVFSICGGFINVRRHAAAEFHITRIIEQNPQYGIDQLILHGDTTGKIKYRTEWEKEYYWIRPVDGDKFKAKCVICDKVFSITGGLSHVKTHLKSKLHTENALLKQKQDGTNHPIPLGDTNKQRQKKNRRDLQDAASSSHSTSSSNAIEGREGNKIYIDCDDSDGDEPTDTSSPAKKARVIPIDLDDSDEEPSAPSPVPPKQKRVLVVPNHQQSVMSNLSYLWKAGRLCDAIISNGTMNIKVHKTIFGAVCPKVLDIFYNTPQDKFPKVTFPDSISEEALMAFAEYMYNGVLDLDPDLLIQMKIIAQRLDMMAFERLCNSQLQSLFPQNILPTSDELMLSEPCSSSGLIEERTSEYNQIPVFGMASASNKIHQNNSLSVDLITADNIQNVSHLDSPLEVCAETKDNLMEVVNNNLVFSAVDDNCDVKTSTPLMKVEKVDPGDEQYGWGAVSSGIDYSTSDSIVTNNFPYFSNTDLSQSSSSATSTSQHANNTLNKFSSVGHNGRQNNTDKGNIHAVVNPSDPYPNNLHPANWANVPLHTQEIKKEYNTG